MGEIENHWLRYLDDPAHFAELVNGWLMGGRQAYDAADITPWDRRFDQAGTKDRESTRGITSRYRDLYKQAGGCRYRLLVGVELSSYRDYLAPVRVMDYDALAYQLQARQITRRHAEKKDLKEDELLSGFSKKDWLVPTVTLYLYTGSEIWDAPARLHDLLDWRAVPKDIRPYIADYPVHVLDISHTPDGRLRQFPGELAGIFLLIKHQKDKMKMREILASTPALRHISTEGFELVGRQLNLSGVQPQIKNNEEEQDMCQAIMEMMEDSKMEGIKIGEARGISLGEARGISLGEARGISLGEAQGIKKGKTSLILSMLEDLGTVPEKLRERICSENDMAALKIYTKKAATAQSIEQFMNEIGA